MVGERGIIKDSFHTDIKVPLIYAFNYPDNLGWAHFQGGINKLSHDYARAELAKFDPPTQPVMISGWGESLKRYYINNSKQDSLINNLKKIFVLVFKLERRLNINVHSMTL